MIITENCIIEDMPEKDYHKDPTPILDGFKQSSSFSSSMAIKMVECTEEEAMLSNQRLNKDYEEKTVSEACDIGTMAHDFILKGGKDTYEIANFSDWRTDAAKAAKANIEIKGLIALNNTTAEKIIPSVEKMRTKLLEKLSGHVDYPDLMQSGRGELSAFAFDGTIWNRARLDWVDDKYPDVIVDYKTTGLDFEQWDKKLWDEKYMQPVHYPRVKTLITGRPSKFIFVVQKHKEPFDSIIIEISDAVKTEVEMRYEVARQRFINCLKTGIWRGTPPYTFHSCPPPWILQRWEGQAINGDIIESKNTPDNVMAAG